MLRDKISFLSSGFRKARAAFNEKMTGVKDKDPRWRTCTGVTNDNMGVPIGTLYVNNFFKETTREKVYMLCSMISLRLIYARIIITYILMHFA